MSDKAENPFFEREERERERERESERMASFVAEAIDQIRESTPSTWDKKHDAHVRRTKERSEIL